MSSTIKKIYINKIKSYCHVSSLFSPCFSINIKKNSADTQPTAEYCCWWIYGFLFLTEWQQRWGVSKSLAFMICHLFLCLPLKIQLCFMVLLHHLVYSWELISYKSHSMDKHGRERECNLSLCICVWCVRESGARGGLEWDWGCLFTCEFECVCEYMWCVCFVDATVKPHQASHWAQLGLYYTSPAN